MDAPCRLRATPSGASRDRERRREPDAAGFAYVPAIEREPEAVARPLAAPVPAA